MRPTASAKKMWFIPQRKMTRNPVDFGPKIQRKMCQSSTIYTTLAVLDILPPKKWFAFPADNSAKKCSTSWQ